MLKDPEYTLEAFVREEVAASSDWREWERVRSAEAPGSKVVFPTDCYRMPYHQSEPASDEFLRRGNLKDLFVGGVLTELKSGRWQIALRSGPISMQYELPAIELVAADFDLEQNCIRQSPRLRVCRPAAESNFEVLKRFIETVCRAAGQPGKKLSKDVINDLAQALCDANYTGAAFLAAWEDADLAPNWRKPGPR